MGKSAKLHKRLKKVKSGPNSAPAPSATPVVREKAQAAKKRATLKGKVKTGSTSSKGGILGGADYVEMMMGSRKKARQEAEKLPSS